MREGDTEHHTRHGRVLEIVISLSVEEHICIYGNTIRNIHARRDLPRNTTLSSNMLARYANVQMRKCNRKVIMMIKAARNLFFI